jgi:hypothetical protein
VLCYSATAEKFLSEVEGGEFWASLERKTTFDPDAPHAYSYGYGGARDGQRIPVYHHHAGGPGKIEVFLTGADDASFNDDPGFEYYMLRQIGQAGPHHQLMAATVQLNEQWGEMYVENEMYEWLDPGVRLLTRESPDAYTRMTVPLMHQAKNAYLRCPPGREYRARLDVESPEGGQELRLTFKVHDRNLREVASLPGPVITVEKGRHTVESTAAVPELKDLECIYNDPADDNTVHLMVLAELTKMTSEVLLHRFEVAFADGEGKTSDPELAVDGNIVRHDGALAAGEVVRLEAPTPESERTVYEAAADGNRRVTWLVRRSAPEWQVRNAAVADKGDHFIVGPMRNTFSDRHEIVIAPMRRTRRPFVHRLRGADRATVHPGLPNGKSIRVEIHEGRPKCEIDIVTEKEPRTMTGAVSWKHKNNLLTVRAEKGSRVEVRFG